MFSRIVPLKSQVSWRTMPNDRAQHAARHVADVDAVDRDAPALDLVEAHQQVDQRRLAGAGRADDGDGLAARRVSDRSVHEQDVSSV